MRAMILIAPMLIASCAASVSDSAICTATKENRANLAAGLLIDGGPVSKQAGAVHLVKMRAGCGE